MYRAKDRIIFWIYVLLFYITIKLEPRELILPNLTFNLDTIVIFLNFCACFLFNFFLECCPILIVSQEKKLILVVLLR